VNVRVLAVELSGMNLFVGAGGVFNENGSINTDNAVGFSTSSANLSIAVATVADASATDTRRWTGIAASASVMSAVGLPSEFTVEVKDLKVRSNSVSGSLDSVAATAINWSSLFAATTNPLNGLSGSTSLVVSGLVRLNLGGYVLAVNVASQWGHFRWDLTAEKRYSLGKSTLALLEQVEEPLLFTVYLEGDLPTGFQRMKRETLQMLNEFRAENRLVQFRLVNPSESEDERDRAEVYQQLRTTGLGAVQVETLEHVLYMNI
jgi:hypothetical protein